MSIKVLSRPYPDPAFGNENQNVWDYAYDTERVRATFTVKTHQHLIILCLIFVPKVSILRHPMVRNANWDDLAGIGTT